MKISTKKKTIYGVVALFLFLIVVFSVTISQSTKNIDFCVYDSDDVNLLCVKSTSANYNAYIGAVNSATGSSTFVAGEPVTVSVRVQSTRDLVPPLYLAHVLLKNSDNQVVTIWDVTSQISKQDDILKCSTTQTPTMCTIGTLTLPCAVQPAKASCSIGGFGVGQTVQTFSAPQLPGTYYVSYVVKDSNSGDQTVASEQTIINVIAKSGTCPASSCSTWQSQGTVANGKTQYRNCISYDSSCTELRKTETRTVCNSGYLISGQQGITASDVHACVIYVAPQPTTSKITVYNSNNNCATSQVNSDATLGNGQYTTLANCQSAIAAQQQTTTTTPPTTTVTTTQTNASTDKTVPPLVSDNQDKTNAFTQFFTDFWTTIKDWFYSVFG